MIVCIDDTRNILKFDYFDSVKNRFSYEISKKICICRYLLIVPSRIYEKLDKTRTRIIFI